MFDTPSKPSTAEYRENWERIWGKSAEVIVTPIQIGGGRYRFDVVPIPDMPRDEVRFVTSTGTVYRITNIGAPE